MKLYTKKYQQSELNLLVEKNVDKLVCMIYRSLCIIAMENKVYFK